MTTFGKPGHQKLWDVGSAAADVCGVVGAEALTFAGPVVSGGLVEAEQSDDDGGQFRGDFHQRRVARELRQKADRLQASAEGVRVDRLSGVDAVEQPFGFLERDGGRATVPSLDELADQVVQGRGDLNGDATELQGERVATVDDALARLSDFFEVAAVHANTADTPDGWDLGYRFEDAAATLSELRTDLHGADAQLRALHSPRPRWQAQAARSQTTVSGLRADAPIAVPRTPASPSASSSQPAAGRGR